MHSENMSYAQWVESVQHSLGRSSIQLQPLVTLPWMNNYKLEIHPYFILSRSKWPAQCRESKLMNSIPSHIATKNEGRGERVAFFFYSFGGNGLYRFVLCFGTAPLGNCNAYITSKTCHLQYYIRFFFIIHKSTSNGLIVFTKHLLHVFSPRALDVLRKF